jgi:hypothetical protein
MTADKFRSLAMKMPGAIESAHMGHPDFRLNGRIFATLGYPDENHGMVRLSAAQQSAFVKKAPEIFSTCSGSWGRQGATAVYLPPARVGLVRAALDEAKRNAMKK